MAGVLSRSQIGGILDHNIPLAYSFADAQRSAGRVKKQLDQTCASKQADLACDDVTSGLFKEVKYYKLLTDLYEDNVKLMNCVVAFLNEEITNGRKEEAEVDRLYVSLIKWLGNMENEIRRVLGLPSSEIAEMFEDMRVRAMGFFEMMRTSVFANPKKYAGVVGAVAGGVLLHKYFTGACMVTKLLVKLNLVNCGCATVGWGVALGAGALAGVFLVLVGKSLYNMISPELVGSEPDLRVEPAIQFADINLVVDKIKEALQNSRNDTLTDELQAIAAYWDQFNDFDPELDTESCPVCLDPPQQPVRFHGCVGRHFHCFQCREDVVRSNAGGGICTVCRHMPES